jgi:hypothetical protein
MESSGEDGEGATAEPAERGRLNRLKAWLGRWGWALYVGTAALASLYETWRTPVPADVPGLALYAVDVYRMEVGLATFVLLYLPGIAFALALNNRGFTEVGVSRVRAGGIERDPSRGR